MSIKTSSAKAKGRKLQQWTVNKILARCPQLEPDDCKSNPMGAHGEDCLMSPAARSLLGITVECKARKSLAVYSYYSQASANAPKGMEPVVIIKADRKEPLAVVDAAYFIKLLTKEIKHD